MSLSVSPGGGARSDEDRELASAMAQAAQALEEAGMSAQDLLDELPAAGEEVMRRIYGDALVDDLLREHRAGAERANP
jgi:polyhydroxyalkanoate synthesis regulator phasin